MAKNSKKNAIYFEKNNTKEKLYITIGGKEYLLRNNEYFVNMAMHSLQKIDEEEAVNALDNMFDALNFLYGRDNVEDIALNNMSIDWGELLKMSLALASGMTKEQYDEQIEEDTKNQ